MRASGPYLRKLGQVACLGIVIAASLSGAVAPALEAAHLDSLEGQDSPLHADTEDKWIQKTTSHASLSAQKVTLDNSLGEAVAGGQAKMHDRASGKVAKNVLKAVFSKLTSRKTDKGEDAPPEKTVTRNVDRAQEPIERPANLIKIGDTIKVRANNQVQRVEAVELNEDDWGALTIKVAGRPDSLDNKSENDELTWLRLHYGRIKDKETGKITELPGTHIHRALENGQSVFLEIDGQTYQFIPDGSPVVMGAEEFHSKILDAPDGYEKLKQIASNQEDGLEEEGNRIMIEHCLGIWDKIKKAYPLRKLTSGRLVRYIPDTIQANGRTLPGRV